MGQEPGHVKLHLYTKMTKQALVYANLQQELILRDSLVHIHLAFSTFFEDPRTLKLGLSETHAMLRWGEEGCDV